jgi:hypothetical protein
MVALHWWHWVVKKNKVKLFKVDVEKPWNCLNWPQETACEVALFKIVITFRFWLLNWLLAFITPSSNMTPFIHVVTLEYNQTYSCSCHLLKNFGLFDLWIIKNFNLLVPMLFTTRARVKQYFPPFIFPCERSYLFVL